MSSYAVFGGSVNYEGAAKPLQHLFRPGYSRGMNASQKSGGANMSVDVNVDSSGLLGGLLNTSVASYFGYADAKFNPSIDASDPSNPRNDLVYAYIDLSLITTASTNNAGALKIAIVKGTPNASPSDPSAGTIQSTIEALGGVGCPYFAIARVRVDAGVASILDAKITDLRVPMALRMPYLYGGTSNTNGHLVPNVADDILVLLAAAQSPTNKTLTGTTNKVRAGGANSTLRDASDVQIDLDQREKDHAYPYVVSGCVWSGDAYASTRAASMTSGVVYINGKRLTVAAVTSRTFTASKDTYVDFQDNGDGTALIIYSESTNNAASQVLPSSGSSLTDTIRNAIIVTSASDITSVGSINQGEHDKVLPIASSVPYAVTDSLGNLICNRNSRPTVIGYRQIVSAFTTTTTPGYVDVAGLSVPFIVPTGRKIKAIVDGGYLTSNAVANTQLSANILDVTDTLQKKQYDYSLSVSSGSAGMHYEASYTPSAAGLRTVKMQAKQSAAGTLVVPGAPTAPTFLEIRLD